MDLKKEAFLRALVEFFNEELIHEEASEKKKNLLMNHTRLCECIAAEIEELIGLDARLVGINDFKKQEVSFVHEAGPFGFKIIIKKWETLTIPRLL